MHNTDIVVILVFTFLVFVCGLSFARAGKNMKSFFAAGGALPWWMSGLSLFMSFFSAGTFVVWGAIAYKSGWVAVSIQWTMCIAGIIIGFFIAPRWQKTKALTAAEYITDRLGYKTQKIYTLIFLGISIFSTGAYLYPVAKIVEVSTGIPITTSVIVLGLIILAYTAVGGLWAVIVTDILQFVVLTAAVLIVVPLAFKEVGGVRQFVHLAPDKFFSLVNDEYSLGFITAFGIYNLFFIAGHWAYIQRYTSVATPHDAKKVGLLFAGLYSISPLVWMLPPMIYRVLNPALGELAEEGAYLLMCKQVLPVGMLGLILGGMVFATSSSVNTTLNISAGVFTNDIFKHFKPTAQEGQLIRVGRWATITLGVITIVIALLVPKMGGIVEVVMSLAALTGGAMFLPPLWTLFSKYQTGRSVLTVTVISLAVNAFFKFFAPGMLDVKLSRAAEMGLGVGLPVFLLTCYEIYTRLQNRAVPEYEAYLKQLASKSSPTQDESQADNAMGTKIIGFGVTAIGVLIVSLALISEHRLSLVAGIGTLVVIPGLFIVWQGRK